MDKQPVGQLPDLTQSNNDDEIMVITNSEYNQLKKEKISDFITDLTSTNENNALIKGTDNKLFVTDFGNASNITDGTLPTSVLPEIPLEKIPDIPKDKLPQIEIADLPVSGVTAGEYIYPTNMQVNSKGQIISVENGVTADITKEQIDTVAARPLSDNACTQENFPDEYSYWVEQAHSTFNLSKFEVVGSPTISEDGIASGVFNNSTYLKTTVNKSILLNKSWSVTSGKYISASSTMELIDLAEPGFGASGVVNFFPSNKRLFFNASFDNTDGNTVIDKVLNISDFNYLIARLDFNYSTGTYSLYYDIGNGWELAGTYTPTGENKQLYFIVNSPSSVINIYLSYGNTTLEYDLKYYKIWADGVPVFSGNKTGIDTINDTLSIPYTESTDGTKIVDAAYFDRVQSCYEQTGEALYLTLDEQNQAYYLPQGTVSGMISRNKQKIDELDTTLTAEILQAMPVGASIAYEGTTPPDGWLAESGLEVKKSAYPKLYAVVGDKYNIETTQEGYFRLPDTNISSRFYEGSTTPGTLKDAGLPNIKATGTGMGVSVLIQLSGAAYNSGVNVERLQGGNQDGKRIDFNASRSSSVYGKSATVQPKSITKFFIIKHD